MASYYGRGSGWNVVFSGVVAPEALAAWEVLVEDMRGFGLLNVTSPDL